MAKLFEAIYDNDVGDKRIVLAIDAVSVSPNISVTIEGEVSVDLTQIEKTDAINILRSADNFVKFVEFHASQAIRYFFVIYMCPLDPNYIIIPICLIPQATGNANYSITSSFDEVINNLKMLGFNVVGQAFDGDPGWLHRTFLYAKQLCKAILENPDLTLEELAELSIKVNNGTYIYEDMIPLIKCDRYRKASGAILK